MSDPTRQMGELFVRWAGIVVDAPEVRSMLSQALSLLADSMGADEAEFWPVPETGLEPLRHAGQGHAAPHESPHAQYSIPLFIPSNKRNFGVIRLIFGPERARHDLAAMDKHLALFGEVVATQIERFLGREKEVKESQLHRALAEAAHLLLFMGHHLGEIAAVALEDCLRLVEFKKGVVLVANRENHTYEIKAQHGLGDRQILDYHGNPWDLRHEPLAIRLMRHGEEVNAADLTEHPVLNEVFPPGSNDFACLPLGEEDELLGCIIISEGKPLDALDQVRLDGLHLYSDLVAMAVRNAMLYGQIEQKNRDIEAKTQSLFHYEKLAMAGKMAAAVAHQVRNPLSVMGARMQLLLEARQIDAELGEEIGLYLGKISEIDGTIRELMDLGRPIELRVERQGILEAVKAVANFIEPRCKAKQVHLDLRLPRPESTPQVWLDEAQFQRCLLDLCLNSLAELKLGGNLQLSVVPEGFWVRVQVADNGAGIPDDMKAKIFQPFFTTKAKGSGLGLFNVQRICHAMGAEIYVEDVKPNGARFVLSFPVTQEKPAPLLKIELGKSMNDGGSA